MLRKLFAVVLTLTLTFGLSFMAMAATEAEIEAAIDAGVVWLAGQQNPDGSWGHWEQVAKTGFAVVKLEDRAFELGYDSPFDPAYEYSENVEKGLDYFFANAHTMPISVQPAGDPDTNGNGKGIYFTTGWHETYNTGIAMMAIAASRDPNRVVATGPLAGKTYKDVLQDAVDYFAFGQCDAGWGQGGWWYSHNVGGADNSNSGYAVLGLRYAETYGFNCIVPQFVKDELGIWIEYIQNKDGLGWHTDPIGGSGYTDPHSWVNILKTGNLLFEMEFIGDTAGSSRVQDAVDYLVRHWNDVNSDPGWRGWSGAPAHKQAMYCTMKGLEAFGLDTVDSIDWYDDFAEVLVAQQNPDGSWDWDYWGDSLLGTEWALLTLERVVPPLEVEIDIKPGSFPNSINPDGKGIIPVAILTTSTAVGESVTFDATTVVPETVRFGPDGASMVHKNAHLEDVDQDGDLDMVFHFKTQETGIQAGDTEATLSGETVEGREFFGTDSVRTVPPKGKGKKSPTSLAFEARAPYPQPCNPEVWIPYRLAEDVEMTITIYNASGQLIRVLDLGYQQAGNYISKSRAAYWDGRNVNGEEVSSGIYFYRIQAGDFSAIRKMIVLR